MAGMRGPERLQALVHTVPDFPAPGVLFRDLSPLLADSASFAHAIELLADQAITAGPLPDLIAGMEARGFIFGAALAAHLGTGFVPLRKAGKLPPPVIATDYTLEYGTARLEMSALAVQPGQRVLLVDDLLATGGTALAGAQLLRHAGATVTEALFVIALDDLGGHAALLDQGITTTALLAC
ncbi:adenine phosphoribosyltransferase [Croceibacterium mercuriale]|nr:adenine phosphoribosyltransferase [Croceibacterium mercuriale]